MSSPSNRDLSKLQQMLKSAQADLDSTSREVQQLVFEREHRSRTPSKGQESEVSSNLEYLHKVEVDELSETIDGLRERLRGSRTRERLAVEEAKELKEQNAKLEKSLQETQAMLDTRIALCKSKQQQVQELTQKVMSLSSTHEMSASEKMKAQQDISLSESKLNTQRETIKSLNAQISELNTIKSELEVQNQESYIENQHLKNEIADLKAKVRNQRSSFDHHQDLNDQLEQLKKDNGRLCLLLSRFPEYREFIQYIDENDGVTYLPPTDDFDEFDDSYLRDAPHTYSFTRGGSTTSGRNEWKNWVPEETGSVISSFRSEYLPHVAPDLFQSLVHQLHQVWYRREQERVFRIQQKLEDEIRALRRQMSHRTPYEDVINSNKLAYMKKELRKLDRARSSPTKSYYSPSKYTAGAAGSMISSTLLSVDSLSKQLMDIQEENRELHDKIESFKSERDSIFMEGASWICRKIVDLTERLSLRISTLKTEFQTKVTSINAGEPVNTTLNYPPSPPQSPQRTNGFSSPSRKLGSIFSDIDLSLNSFDLPSPIKSTLSHNNNTELGQILELQNIFLKHLEKLILSYRTKLRHVFDKVPIAWERKETDTYADNQE
eukprot:TRINITY_DN7302_c0_g1_i1.p1 TRINITY_DN7302_c0_g1~~TRINITY_DN7302_c0_g1_i1.p1  ORF type:complete len:606 (-),score=139.08 TRINITY_DN7302_c0_g1_i1:52-1869(-)